MPQSHVLIVAIDGLRASALGAYGNTSYPTPALDQFAAESLLLDACFAPAAELPAIYRALWQLGHTREATTEAGNSATYSLPQLFRENGYQATLIADDSILREFVGAADFDRAIEAEPSLTNLFAQASDQISRLVEIGSERPHFVWVHSRGMYGPWDAPVKLQESLRDEGDPPPVECGDPPDFTLAAGDAPDTAFRYGCAYAAQVMLLDECWKGLLSTLDDSPIDGPWLVVLLGVRGFPLGEHARIGGMDGRLHVEQLHVPWLLRFPAGRGRLLRCHQLVTHADLLPTLRAWLSEGSASAEVCENSGGPLAGRSLLPLIDQPLPPWREALLASKTDARAVRTAAWTLRQDATTEVYVRPDDRFEANDVADRCPEIVAELEQLIAETSREHAVSGDHSDR